MTDEVAGTAEQTEGNASAGVFISHVHEDKPLADAFSILIQDITSPAPSATRCAGSVASFSSSDNSGVETSGNGEMRRIRTLARLLVTAITHHRVIPGKPETLNHTIFEGTSEIQQLVIARAISGMRVK